MLPQLDNRSIAHVLVLNTNDEMDVINSGVLLLFYQTDIVHTMVGIRNRALFPNSQPRPVALSAL